MVRPQRPVVRALFPPLEWAVARAEILGPFGYPFQEHTAILFKGGGVVHVHTEMGADGTIYASTDVTIARYRNGVPTQHLPLAGSVCFGGLARVMHEHWCDRDRLRRCLRRDSATLFVLDIDWEIEDDDEDDDPEDDDLSAFPEISAIYDYARSRPVRVDDAVAQMRRPRTLTPTAAGGTRPRT